MATITLSLSGKKDKVNDKCEIYLRLSVDRSHVFRAKTGLYIRKGAWNNEKQKVIIPRMKTIESMALTELQGTIDTLCNNIIGEVMSTPIDMIDKMWLEALIGRLTGKSHGRIKSKQDCKESFEEHFENYIIAAQGRNKHRADLFRGMLRTFKRFCMYAGISMDIDGITAEHLSMYEKFLQIEHTFFDSKKNCVKHKKIYEVIPYHTIPKERGLNTVNDIMRRLRAFYNWALKHKLTTNNPFATYKMPACVYGTPFFLKSEERDKLFEYDLSSNPTLAIQRDIFVFQSNVGMRVGDLYELTAANIVNGALEYVANKSLHKSGKTIRVPLSKQAKIIVERYKSANRVELFPFISMQKYNVAIKKALKLAGIDRMVTVLNPTTRIEEQHPIWEVASSHMGRRNFIGNLYNKTQDPNAIGSMTGHAEGSKAFARYRSIDDTVKKTLIDLL